MRVLLLVVWSALCWGQKVGPANGSLVVVGGGSIGDAILSRFLELAGGPEAKIVVIPTADERNEFDQKWIDNNFLTKAGVKSLTVLHTRDRKVSASEEFIAPLKTATGVWFTGGRQWRLVDSYLDTPVHIELNKLLARGGVIGGTSAGATIQGSYLVRGAREGNTVMMAPGYEKGLAFLNGVAIDQHLLKRNRQDDMLSVIDRHPELLGIGIDESTAIVVRGDRFEVIGESKVAVYDSKFKASDNGKRYYFLEPGDRFDLASRRKVTQ